MVKLNWYRLIKALFLEGYVREKLNSNECLLLDRISFATSQGKKTHPPSNPIFPIDPAHQGPLWRLPSASWWLQDYHLPSRPISSNELPKHAKRRESQGFLWMWWHNLVMQSLHTFATAKNGDQQLFQCACRWSCLAPECEPGTQRRFGHLDVTSPSQKPYETVFFRSWVTFTLVQSYPSDAKVYRISPSTQKSGNPKL